MNLRSYILRNFLMAGFLLVAFAVAGIAWLASEHQQTVHAQYYEGLTQTLAEMVSPSLTISDYGETQRLLKMAEGRQDATLALLTAQGDLLLADYRNKPAFERLTASEDARSCKAALRRLRSENRASASYCAEIRRLDGDGPGAGELGILIASTRLPVLPFSAGLFLAGVLVFIAAIAGIGFWLSRRLTLQVVAPIESTMAFMDSVSLEMDGPDFRPREPSVIVELEKLNLSFSNLIKRFRKEHKQRQEKETELQTAVAHNQLASQVAHDIRSPLAALESVLSSVAQLPEEKRLIIRGAVGRIRDIANHLLDRHREASSPDEPRDRRPASGPAPAQEPASVCLLSGLIDPLITEKRLQFRSRIGIEIESRLGAASYGLFARIQPNEFKRVLSNLINNSVEAMHEKGLVTVSLAPEAGQVVVRIQDDGAGIPPEILAKLGKRGQTHGKAGGSGLGLYHAGERAQAWGGGLELESEPGKGTVVRLRFPQAPAPAWFVSKLELDAGCAIVVLDDDTSIHQIWQGRFDSLRLKERGIEVLHLSTPEQLRTWVRENPAAAESAVFLTDQELLGYQETGLSLVAELGLGERAILVTSRFDEKGILEQCLDLKARMIPKGQAGFVPVLVRPKPERVDAVLIDDDALTHMSWSLAAKASGKVLRAFSAPSQFLELAAVLDKATPIYLDSKLGDGARGEDFAKDLHARGFTRLFLCTGYAPKAFPPMPWIAEILGKEPPWPARAPGR